jgi:hypothetical protein
MVGFLDRELTTLSAVSEQAFEPLRQHSVVRTTFNVIGPSGSLTLRVFPMRL